MSDDDIISFLVFIQKRNLYTPEMFLCLGKELQNKRQILSKIQENEKLANVKLLRQQKKENIKQQLERGIAEDSHLEIKNLKKQYQFLEAKHNALKEENRNLVSRNKDLEQKLLQKELYSNNNERMENAFIKSKIKQR